MGNSLMHCLGCVLPCGALDLIRVVHLNGHVQRFSPPLLAGEILKSNPGHVLTTPSSSDDHSLVRRFTVLSPESHLRRGGIYFLIPASSDHRKAPKNLSSPNSGVFPDSNVDVILLKKPKSGRRDRRRSRSCGGAWEPHLHSISEDQ